jgi:hypothetical protein
MPKYLIESSHTARECVWALKVLLSETPETLDQFQWGCRDGEHVGWAVVEAENKFVAQELVPLKLRPKARIVELYQFRPEEIRAFHEGAIASEQARGS